MMKKSFTLILFVLSFLSISFGQIVITEIMYNDPTSGRDTLEFIELYNAGSSAVDLDGYRFSAGVEDTINGVSLNPGEYWVVAEDSTSMRLALGVSTDQWSDGGLSNGGELIELVDASGTVVDSVRYAPSNGWPSLANGNGPSLVLCDPSTDNNDPTNWAAASTGTGVSINGAEVFANPGADSDCSGTINYPLYDISRVTTNTPDGTADSLTRLCELRGIVLGVNIGADRGDIQFTIQDATGGIAVFDNDGNSGYTVQEGDEVSVKGFIGQFRGLTQINPDSINILSTGNTLPSARVVPRASESTESELIRINGVHIVDTSAWTNSGTGFNVLITDGGADTTALRVDGDVNLFGTMARTDTFDVVGIGGQFDTADPLNEGYQILPRYVEDLLDIVSSVNDPALGAQIELFPNPSTGIFQLNLGVQVDEISVYNSLGKLLRTYKNVTDRQTLDLTNQSSGIYFVRFMLDDRQWVEQVLIR